MNGSLQHGQIMPLLYLLRGNDEQISERVDAIQRRAYAGKESNRALTISGEVLCQWGVRGLHHSEIEPSNEINSRPAPSSSS